MKLRTLRYHINEGIRSIFKNGLMSLASIAVVGACIFIVIVSLCMAVNIDYVLEQIEANVGISVMFGEEPDESDIAGIEQQVKQIPHVTEVKYYSKDDALDQAKTMFDADALEGLREDNPLPRSFDIKVDDIANQESVIKELENIRLEFEKTFYTDKQEEPADEQTTDENVQTEETTQPVTNEAGAVVPVVIDSGEATTEAARDTAASAEDIGKEGYVFRGIEKINHLKEITDVLVTINIIVRVCSVILIGILCFISVGIIMNTIKLTVFIRKSEINIMKYVGATDWFIRWPFVIEGIIIGLIGALIPTGICWLVYDRIADFINNTPFIKAIAQLKTAADIFCVVGPVALLIGVLLGAIGSINSLEKHLNV